MNNSEAFSKELGYIRNTETRSFVAKVLDTLPDYFRHIGASTSGKHHPAYTLGEGGLIRHTKAAVGIFHQLVRADIQKYFCPEKDVKYDFINQDIVYSALLLHDGLKCGMWEDKTAFDHPLLMSKYVRQKSIEFNFKNEVVVDCICDAIKSHMGKWNTRPDTDIILPVPVNGLEKLVHLCDYLASRKNIEYKFDIEDSEDT